MQPTKDSLEAASCVLWILNNKFVNESRKPIEFVKHRFLIDYLNDDHPLIVTRKAAQIGLTVAETLRAFHLAAFKNLNVIHTLQTSDVIKGFVFPKVNPIIESNPAIKKLIKLDSENLKQFNNAFIFYRGAQSESQAINITADVLNIDEYDRSNQTVVEMYQSRLDASDYKWKRYFSNPSTIGFGVDQLYQESNQLHWFITCHHCGYEWFIDYYENEDDGNHFVDTDREIYVCGKCKKEISNGDRISGRWVAKFPDRYSHGYWFNQAMCPWISAADMIQKEQNDSIDYFYNFVLGKAYTPTDLIVNRETILRACVPSTIQKLSVVIGVDQNASGQIWVAATPEGIFAHGKTKSWEELERLKLMWNATIICDPAPYPTMPKIMAQKYKDWYLCYFKPQVGLSMLRWKDQVVYADRTRLLDVVAKEIGDSTLLFRERPNELEDYIADWQNLYRTTEEKEDGRMISIWKKKENKESDYSFATAYCRIGLSRMIGGSSSFMEPRSASSTPVTDIIMDGQLKTNLDQVIKETFEDME